MRVASDDNVTPIRKTRTVNGRQIAADKNGKPVIPQLPAKDEVLPVDEIATRLDDPQDLTLRTLACVNMKLAGAPWPEIAATLGYKTPNAARTDYTRALAQTHQAEDWETLRVTESARAEALFRRSLAMASADYLIDGETGEKFPNVDRLRWHQQANADLALHAMISGAKAPAKLEITPGEQQFESLVNRMLIAQGHEEVLEAEVLELEEIPRAPSP